MKLPDASRRTAAAVLLGALSALMYGSGAMSALFLAPVQAAGAALGFRAMLISAASAALATAVGQTVLLSMAGGVSAATLAISLSPQAAMAAALVAIAWPRLARYPFVAKILAGSLAASLASLPGLVAALNDQGLRALFESMLATASGTIGAALPPGDQAWETISKWIASAFGGAVLAFLLAGAWIGSSFGRLAARSRSLAEPADAIVNPPTLAGYKVPAYLVWVLLAAWAALLALRLKPVLLISAAASNAAIALSICYGIQGLAVAGALAERAGMAPAARLLGPLVVVLVLFGRRTGLAVGGLVALVGTLETWIPFRAAKGEPR